MKRRDFLGVLGGAAVAWPLASSAQQVMPVVGFLRPIPPTVFPETLKSFQQGLGALGFVEGRNVTIEHRWSAGRYEALTTLAKELAQQKVSVIFTGGGAVSTLAAKAVTTTI